MAALLPDTTVLRICLADSVDRVRQAVRDLIDLQPDMQVIGEATDAAALLSCLVEQHPDVVLLDARLAGAAPVAILLVRQVTPTLPIMVYMANPAPGEADAALAAGACAFLPKDVLPHELLGVLRQVAARVPNPPNSTGLLTGQGGGTERDQNQIVGSYGPGGHAYWRVV